MLEYLGLGQFLNLLTAYYKKIRNDLSLTGRCYQEHIAMKDGNFGEGENHGSLSVRNLRNVQMSVINATILARVTLHKTVESFYCRFLLCSHTG